MNGDADRALLSPSDVADLARVSRPVVSNWRKRHEDFPPAADGSEAKPLFKRDDVLAWLRRRGHEVREESAGSRLWAALNASRDQATLDDFSQLTLLLATLRQACPSALDDLASVPPEQQGERLRQATIELHDTPALAHVPEPTDAVLQLLPNAAPLIDAVRRTDAKELAEAADHVLGKLSRTGIKRGAEHGFVGSRTSAMIASLVRHCTGTVYDPACGIANILLRVADVGAAERVIGSDIDASALGVAAQRAFLRTADIELIAGDVLADDPIPGLLADVVVAEPPFGASFRPTATAKANDPRSRHLGPSRRHSELAWLQHAIAHLAPEGRAYVLTSPGALSRSGPERRIRAGLLSAGCIETVVALPTRMLPQTSMAQALWVLRPECEASEVTLIDASDVTDIESRLPALLSRESTSPVGDTVPHVSVALTDVLAADAVLAPSRWLGEFGVDTAAIASTFSSAADALTQSTRRIGTLSIDLKGLVTLPKARIVTVRNLLDDGVLSIRPRRLSKGLEHEEPPEERVVSVRDIGSGPLPTVKHLEPFEDGELTEAGDVLVATIRELRATVDESGGHALSGGIERIRINELSVITPHYLAAVITGSWNARFQLGSHVSRIPLRDLEIPLIPTEDQHALHETHAAIADVEVQAARLEREASTMRSALLDSLRHGVALGPSGSSQSAQVETGSRKDPD